MAFDQGLSGLNAAATELDVIGNNIANAGTVGFKASKMQFADVYARALGGGGSSSVGIGVSSAKVWQHFSQGTITSSNNPMSMAVSGNGFFRLSDNGTIGYTRDGQFHLDPKGAIVTSSGANVQGYLANENGILNTGVTTNLVINSANLPPKLTGTVKTVLNLDSGAAVLSPAAFDSTNPATYTYSTSVAVYDSLGNDHSLQTYYVNKGIVPPATEAQWDVFATMDGTPVGFTPPAAPVPVGTFSFTSAGTLDPASSVDIPVSFPFTNGATSPQAITVSYAGTTQFGTASSVNSLSQDGFASGQLTQFSTGPDGVITGTYSNGQTQALGQIVLNSFVNPGGLDPAGNNMWLASSSSGEPILGTPGIGDMGSVQANSVENSTTDLTAELVKMITAQQNYQANAQTIKAANQMSQTLVNLRN